MGMMELARHIIATSQETKLGVTNLQLQKVLYFTLLNAFKDGRLTREDLHDIYDRDFLVWRYGPVVESIYQKYSIFGASTIFKPEDEIQEYSFLNDYIINLLKENPFDLVGKSHQHSHWKNNEGTITFGRGPVSYSLEDLVDAANE